MGYEWEDRSSVLFQSQYGVSYSPVGNQKLRYSWQHLFSFLFKIALVNSNLLSLHSGAPNDKQFDDQTALRTALYKAFMDHSRRAPRKKPEISIPLAIQTLGLDNKRKHMESLSFCEMCRASKRQVAQPLGEGNINSQYQSRTDAWNSKVWIWSVPIFSVIYPKCLLRIAPRQQSRKNTQLQVLQRTQLLTRSNIQIIAP